MIYGRIQDGQVAEIVELPEGVAPADRYHPSLDFRPLPADAQLGWLVDGSSVVAPPEPGPLSPEDLAELKQVRKVQVDASAEVERGKYITLGAGQAMTYQRKTEEARLYVQAVAAEQEIGPADFPLLQATIGIDGPTIGAVAELVLQMDAQWAVIGAAIEAARLGAKAAIDVAEDEAAVLAVQPAWPAPD